MKNKVQELAKKLEEKWMKDHNNWRTPVWGYFRDMAERILDGREKNPLTPNQSE